jgi:hypothetical protein
METKRKNDTPKRYRVSVKLDKFIVVLHYYWCKIFQREDEVSVYNMWYVEFEKTFDKLVQKIPERPYVARALLGRGKTFSAKWYTVYKNHQTKSFAMNTGVKQGYIFSQVSLAIGRAFIMKKKNLTWDCSAHLIP